MILRQRRQIVKNDRIAKMSYVADLHIHSRFSRACSPQLTIPNLAQAAKLKGISLLGTGDFLHPLWFAELKRDLKEVGNGFLEHNRTTFALTCEVSLIYSHLGKVRRIHLVIMLPSLDDVSKLQSKLLRLGAKLSSDGRPILGMSIQDFCGISFEINPKTIIIPAHIWTPWFGLFGSKSGYDSLEDCFGSFADKIYAVETGLSSDPEMNWRIGQLDSKSIVSFSDAHSLPKIDREATIFESEMTYGSLLEDLKKQRIETIEYFPEEGKYHYDGHRKCNYSQAAGSNICPICNKLLTIGVLNRVEKLADRKKGTGRKFKKLIPLEEIIAETLHAGVSSQKVLVEYKKLTGNLGAEIKILTNISLEEIAKISEKISGAIGKVRKGDLAVKPGYDGVYGVIKISNDDI